MENSISIKSFIACQTSVYLFLIRGKSKIDWFRKRSGCICAISIPLLSPLFFQFVVNEKICGHTRHSLFFETKQKTNLLVQEVAPGWLELGMNEDFRILLSSSSVCKEVKVKDYYVIFMITHKQNPLKTIRVITNAAIKISSYFNSSVLIKDMGFSFVHDRRKRIMLIETNPLRLSTNWYFNPFCSIKTDQSCLLTFINR